MSTTIFDENSYNMKEYKMYGVSDSTLVNLMSLHSFKFLIIISSSSAFSKSSLNIWKFTVHVLLKPGLENFEHYFTSV